MRTRFQLLGVLMALVLVFAACADDDAESTTTTVADGTTSTTATTTTGDMDETTTTSGDIDDGDDMDETSELLERYEETPLRTTYIFFQGSTESEVTLSQDPTADPPVEAVIIPEANAKLITMGDDSIFCDTSSNQCFEVPGVGEGFSAALLGPFAGGLFIAAELEQIPGATMTEETVTVAGRDGTCFTFEAPAQMEGDTEFLRQCIDAELGFTLLIEARESDSDVVEPIMELIEFGDPRPEDFEPSGPVTATP